MSPILFIAMTLTHQQRNSAATHPKHSPSAIFSILLTLCVLVGSDTVIAIAYAKPPPSRTCQEIFYSADRKEMEQRRFIANARLACALRCGGTARNGLSIPKRLGTSFFSSTRSEGGGITTNFEDGGRITNANTQNYHLIWSPNFWKKIVISTAFWWVVQFALSKTSGSVTFDRMTCHNDLSAARWQSVLSSSIVLPLLSSSCCAIQLLINALSGWGCAGFNTFLGKSVVDFFS